MAIVPAPENWVSLDLSAFGVPFETQFSRTLPGTNRNIYTIWNNGSVDITSVINHNYEGEVLWTKTVAQAISYAEWYAFDVAINNSTNHIGVVTVKTTTVAAVRVLNLATGNWSDEIALSGLSTNNLIVKIAAGPTGFTVVHRSATANQITVTEITVDGDVASAGNTAEIVVGTAAPFFGLAYWSDLGIWLSHWSQSDGLVAVSSSATVAGSWTKALTNLTANGVRDMVFARAPGSGVVHLLANRHTTSRLWSMRWTVATGWQNFATVQSTGNSPEFKTLIAWGDEELIAATEKAASLSMWHRDPTGTWGTALPYTSAFNFLNVSGGFLLDEVRWIFTVDYTGKQVIQWTDQTPPPPLVEVPDLTEMTASEAEDALIAVGLILGDTTYDYSYVTPIGHIMNQDPSAGEDAIIGSAVDILVSIGPATVIVPDLAGMTLSEVDTALTNGSLVRGRTTGVFLNTELANPIVKSQYPLASAEVAVNSSVDIMFNLGTRNGLTYAFEVY